MELIASRTTKIERKQKMLKQVQKSYLALVMLACLLKTALADKGYAFSGLT